MVCAENALIPNVYSSWALQFVEYNYIKIDGIYICIYIPYTHIHTYNYIYRYLSIVLYVIKLKISELQHYCNYGKINKSNIFIKSLITFLCT